MTSGGILLKGILEHFSPTKLSNLMLERITSDETRETPFCLIMPDSNSITFKTSTLCLVFHFKPHQLDLILEELSEKPKHSFVKRTSNAQRKLSLSTPIKVHKLESIEELNKEG